MNAFTFDVDWAPEAVIEDVVGLLEEYGVAGTFFATHRSALLETLARGGRHEVGIHPNFNPLLTGKVGDYKHVMDELLGMYPGAVGMRSHSLAHSCPILIYAMEKGIRYDSNIYVPFGKNVTPFDYFGLTRIPYNWEDDGQWFARRDFTDSGVDLKAPMNVFSFHPIHVYLNTATQEMYDDAKHLYQLPEQLIQRRNTRTAGTRDLLVQLLAACKKDKLSCVTLASYCDLLARAPGELPR